MKLAYPKKILVAWGEAISGNSEIRDWLMKNGYPELGVFVFALHLKPDARQWLIKKYVTKDGLSTNGLIDLIQVYRLGLM